MGDDRRSSVAFLASSLPAARVIGDGAREVTGLVYDSRSVGPGDLFAALPGAYVDGHEFADRAVDRGAAALLVEREVAEAATQIVVPDSRAALATIASAFYRAPSREVGTIGITGTDGKTTTSYLVDAILRSSGCQTGLVGTIAIRLGDEEDVHTARQTTPESADIQRLLRQMADRHIPWAIIEATSHGLAMHRLDGTRFRIAAVTNITREHLDFHGTVERYRRAKGILFERAAAAGGVAVINADDEGALAMRDFARGSDILTYSAAGAPADVQASDVVSDGAGSCFVLRLAQGGEVPVSLPLIGAFNVANALCAAGVAVAAGIDLDTIAAGLAAAPPVPGRMALVRQGQPFAVVVDYAHTPEAMEKVLPLLRQLYPAGRLIVVFGSAGERDVEKRSRQGAVAARLADVSIVTSEDPRFEEADEIIAQIADGAIAAGSREGTDLFRFTMRDEAIRFALTRAWPQDCVLLAGKGHETSIIWGAEKRPWNESAVAASLLAELGYAVGS